jgi:hypothetical protein
MKTTQKGFIIPLLIIIIAVLAIGGGFYIHSQNKKMAELNSNVSIDNNDGANPALRDFNADTSASSSSNKTLQGQSNYLTYSNSEIGIKFAYPLSWKGVIEEVASCLSPTTNRVYVSTECKGIYLAPESASIGPDFPWGKRFLYSYTKNYANEQPGRGGAYDDFVANAATKDYCQNNASYVTSCKVFMNSSGIEIAKMIMDVPVEPDCIEGCWGHKVLYYVHNPKASALFQGVLFSTADDEKTLDEIVNTFQFI